MAHGGWMPEISCRENQPFWGVFYAFCHIYSVFGQEMAIFFKIVPD